MAFVTTPHIILIMFYYVTFIIIIIIIRGYPSNIQSIPVPWHVTELD